MINKTLSAVSISLAALSIATPAAASQLLSTPSRLSVNSAGVKIQTGGLNGLTYQAQSRIVGVGSTGTAAAGGNPIYNATDARYSGVVALIINRESGSFICSGSLLPDRRSILTAAHCVSDGAGTANPLSATAFFNNGTDADAVLNASPLSTGVSVSNFFVNPGYTGNVIDQNDVAVLRLSELAPAFAQAYDILTGDDLVGDVFNVAGVGGRSTVGGNVGVNAGTGRRRQGDNRFDFAFGDAGFGGFFTDVDGDGANFFTPVGGPTAAVDFSFISDFDNGLAANDASCLLGGAFGLTSSQFCDLGLGLREVSVAGGDSGGPQFINGRIASVTSYGLSFGGGFGDLVPGLQSSFGELNGFVPTFLHAGFIRASLVPEPSTWAMMILGFGLVGSAARRRTKVRVAYS